MPVIIHDSRRTGIPRDLLPGVAPAAVRELAGHKDLKTTLRYYAEVGKDDLRQAKRRLREAVERRRDVVGSQ